MPNLILPSRFTSQPQYPAPIDRGNSLTRGLQYVQTGPNFDGFTNNNGVTVSPLSLGRWGPATSATYVSGSLQYFSRSAPLVTGFPFTMAAVFRKTTASVNSGLISIGASTNDRHLLYVISSNAPVMFSGAGGTTGSATGTASSVSVATPYVAVGRVTSATSRDVWLNGKLGGSNTTSVSPAATNTLAIGGYWSTGAPVANYYWGGEIPLAAVWNRALSDAEIVEFSRNPWQIFQAPARRLYVPDSGVAPTFKAAWAQQRSQVIGVGVH